MMNARYSIVVITDVSCLMTPPPSGERTHMWCCAGVLERSGRHDSASRGSGHCGAAPRRKAPAAAPHCSASSGGRPPRSPRRRAMLPALEPYCKPRCQCASGSERQNKVERVNLLTGLMVQLRDISKRGFVSVAVRTSEPHPMALCEPHSRVKLYKSEKNSRAQG